MSKLTGAAALISTDLPPLYASWAVALLGGAIPREREAACDNCAMCAGPEAAQSSAAATFFHPDTKCCTYLPALPNFAVGRVLSDAAADAAFGRATVEARVRAGIGVTPLGVNATPTFAILYRHGHELGFGRSRALRCPHYADDGRCGIWRHRNATCATWFCKHVRGAVGQRFWQTLHRLLATVERDLGWWCVMELGIGRDALRRLLSPLAPEATAERLSAADLDGGVDPATYQAVWAEWAGREAAFFIHCARLIDGLTWSEVRAIGGPELHALEELTKAAYHDLVETALPRRLTLGAFQVLRSGRSTTQICSYDRNDPLSIPTRAFECLPAFDGRPRRHVMREIARNRGVRFGEAVVRKLADFNVLVPVTGEDGPRT